MNQNRNFTVGLFIVTAILVTISFNLGTFRWILGLLEQDAGEPPERHFSRLRFGLFISGFQFAMFLIFAFFNYYWKSTLFSSLPEQTKTLAIIGANLLLFALFVYLELVIFRANFDFTPKRLGGNYFLLSSYPIAGIAIAEAYFLILLKKVRATEVEKAQLEEEKSNAELAVLKDQLSPHFFFNTLSSLSTIVRNEEKEVGLEFIQEMSKTYRYTLSSRQQDLVKLKEEVEFLQSYIFLLKKRFGNKVTVEINFSEKAYNSSIPPMSLQLLVENAIQHNVITKTDPITVRIFDKDGQIWVENKLKPKESKSVGIGLKNLADRYRLLAKKEINISKDDHMFRVKLPLI
jgi:sensor histidine kinase YesM